MKIEESKMNKMVLTELESLDPVTVLIEEFGKAILEGYETIKAVRFVKDPDSCWT